MDVATSTALLLLRVVIGLLFVGHGTQKLFGWFGGHGPEGTGGFLASLGYHPGKHHAVLAGLTEAGAGLLFALGLLTPFAVAGLIGVMVNAIGSAHWKNGLWVTDGGFEYPLVTAVIAAAIGLTGPGGYSIDHAIQRSANSWHLWGGGWGVFAIAVGMASGVGMLATRRTAPTVAASAGETEAEHRRVA